MRITERTRQGLIWALEELFQNQCMAHEKSKGAFTGDAIDIQDRWNMRRAHRLLDELTERTKVCLGCGLQPVENFYVHRTRRYGTKLQAFCKICHIRNCKENYAKRKIRANRTKAKD